ncbi:MAG: rhodanese-like domain-containing protein [Chloroherpetonaceae bacterium]|nr:rhodanese-like domain-containing protein [Chthonomonadaceae bacterium]MDW8206273.1 rhodanese-like domain-containing protein [Chloroherpetonaceae bacterium]
MYRVETIVTPGLAQNSYMILSGNEAAVIDPRRDVQIYKEIAEREGVRITHVFETHSHADFVSGGPQLAAETGATLYISALVNPNVPHQPLHDNDTFQIGDARIVALHTPGHTPEHMAYYVTDTADLSAPPALFSGDLMFVGDLGRPELLGQALAEELAPKLYDSVFGVIGMLPPETILYPGHGAGSLCGRTLSEKPTSTLGEEFATNPALQIRDKQEFVAYMMSGQPRVPTNFSRMAALNRAGVPLLPEQFPAREFRVEEVEAALQDPTYLVVDARSPEEYAAGHIPGSVYLGLDPGLPTWLGWLFSPDRKIVAIVHDEAQARDYFAWLARVGYDNLVGYLPGGITAWQAAGKPVETLTVLPPETVRHQAEHPGEAQIIDVRTPREFAAGTLPGAHSIPLCELPGRMQEVPTDRPVTLMCQGGYRGTIAASLLLNAGYRNVANAAGGYAAVTAAEPALTRA